MHVTVWHDHEHCNGYGEFINLLRSVAGDEPADWMLTPFSMGDVDALHSLCLEAGIANASIQTLEGHANFPSIERWITTQVRGTPLAAMLDDATCATILNEVQTEFAHFLTQQRTVQFDMQAHVIKVEKA